MIWEVTDRCLDVKEVPIVPGRSDQKRVGVTAVPTIEAIFFFSSLELCFDLQLKRDMAAFKESWRAWLRRPWNEDSEAGNWLLRDASCSYGLSLLRDTSGFGEVALLCHQSSGNCLIWYVSGRGLSEVNRAFPIVTVSTHDLQQQQQ